MTTVLSVDVGLHGLGCGYYTDGELDAGWYTALPENLPRRGPEGWRAVSALLLPLGLDPDEVVVEVMQVYEQSKWKGDPADLLELQGVCAMVVGRYPRARAYGYLPRVWKGQVPVGVFARRVAENCARWGWTDRIYLPARCARGKDRTADLYHGVGVGLHHLGHMRGGQTRRR